MVMLTTFVLYLKYPFLVNLVPKFVIAFLKRNLVSRIIEICRLNDGVCFICFWLEIPCLGKFCAKNQNCQFKLKFSTQINSNMKNSMMMLIFSVFDKMYPFLRNLFQKIKIVFDLNMQNLMMIFIFFFFFFRSKVFFSGLIWSTNSRSQSRQLLCHEIHPHFGFPGYQPWSATVPFLFKT